MSRSSSTLPPLPGSPGVFNCKSEKKSESQKKMDITIHVCDEAKNLKKDFSCPKSLLLEEMKYFQDYLSSDHQTWEDIDISVHCDVKIFDWLIRYVKRDKENQDSGPILSAKSAVSILISSEFLKMAKLVERCITFCHDHMSEIIASPCNMNCINDPLVKRISATFTQHDLEQVVDKKDKFKSKLFCKKIEELFNPNFSNEYSHNNASKLYKCLHCQKLLLPPVEKSIKCTVARTMIDHHGNLQYVHSRDTTWDVQEYLQNLKQQFKTWRSVFWRVWSVINFLQCNHCDEVFPVSDYNCCRYHPKQPIRNGTQAIAYPCCDQKSFHFEPIKSKNGCKFGNHQVSFKDNDVLHSQVIFDELLGVVSLVCEERTPIQEHTAYSLDAMIKTEQSRKNKHITSVTNKEEKHNKNNKRPVSQKQRPPLRSNSSKSNFVFQKPTKYLDLSEEDNSDLDEPGIVRIVIQHKDAPTRVKTSAKTWNNDLPIRLNQDLQRESDVKRMNDLIKKLSISKPPSTHNSTQTLQQDKSTFDGGLYCRIESKVRNSLQSNNVHSSNSLTNTSTYAKGHKYK